MANVSGVSSAIASAIANVSAKSEYSVAVAGKALDAQRQEGQAALQLIAATGKGSQVDLRA